MRRFFIVILMLSFCALQWAAGDNNDRREIKILRQTPSEIDRAISDHLCMSYEVIHPYHRCLERYYDQGDLDQKALREYDFIITTEQFYNESLANDFQLVLPLYHQAFTVVSRGISRDELFTEGQSFGVLDQPTQTKVLADVLRAMNINRKKISLRHFSSQELIDYFCSFEINVAFVTGAHPSRIVRQLNTLCGGEPLSIVSALPKNFFQKHRYFYKTVVPKELYWRIPEDIETLSIRHLLAVNNRYDSDELEALMNSFIDELEYNRSLPVTEASILLNYNNLQTPLHEVGDDIIEELQEELQAELAAEAQS